LPSLCPLSKRTLKSHYEILSSKHRVPITQFRVAQHSQFLEFYILSNPLLYNPALILPPRPSIQLLLSWKAHFKSPKMTIQVSNESPSTLAKTLNSTPSKPAFLVFYASLINGSSWCSDCRKAEPIINKKFSDNSDAARIVYVGQKEE
jgi:thiol-disulfide isomerase/thioredoxin